MFVEDGTVTNGEDDHFKVNVHEIRAFFFIIYHSCNQDINMVLACSWCFQTTFVKFHLVEITHKWINNS